MTPEKKYTFLLGALAVVAAFAACLIYTLARHWQVR